MYTLIDFKMYFTHKLKKKQTDHYNQDSNMQLVFLMCFAVLEYIGHIFSDPDEVFLRKSMRSFSVKRRKFAGSGKLVHLVPTPNSLFQVSFTAFA